MPEAPRDGWSEENDKYAKAAGYDNWQAWADEVEKGKGRKICGSRNTRNRPCERAPGDPTRCHSHGGKSLVGSAVPAYIDGEKSRYMAHLQGESRVAFQSYRDDPDFLALNNEIALTRAGIEGLLASWPQDVASLEELGEMAAHAIEAIDKRDGDLLAEVLIGLRAGLEPLAMAMAVSSQVDRKVDVLRKLVSTNLKRERYEFEQVSAAQLGMWTVNIRELILEYVPVAADRRAIITRIAAWTG